MTIRQNATLSESHRKLTTQLEQNLNPGLALIDLSVTGARLPGFQKVHSAIHPINFFPVYIPTTYSLDSELSR